jgi:hypothetical protein
VFWQRSATPLAAQTTSGFVENVNHRTPSVVATVSVASRSAGDTPAATEFNQAFQQSHYKSMFRNVFNRVVSTQGHASVKPLNW